MVKALADAVISAGNVCRCEGDMAAFVSVMVTLLIGTSLFEKTTRFYADRIEKRGKDNLFNAVKKLPFSEQEQRFKVLRDHVEEESANFAKWNGPLLQLCVILSIVLSLAGAFELFFCLTETIGKWNAFLFSPLVLYFCGCEIIALVVKSRQNKQINRFVCHASVEEELRIKGVKEKEIESIVDGK